MIKFLICRSPMVLILLLNNEEYKRNLFNEKIVK